MSALTHLLQDLRMLDVWLAARRPVSLGGLPPTLSLSFDDFPASAAQAGAQVLEDNGCRGTFYLSAGLLGGESASGPLAGREDILRLAENGHEIGCHTYGHLQARDTTPEAFARDLEKNAQALAELLGGGALRSFAFPYGSVTPGTKRAAAARFLNCRSTLPRINRGRADLNLLAAAPLYARDGLFEQAQRLLAECVAQGGWLILYTHDVQDRPSPHGCTPRQLAELVHIAVRLGCTLAPVGQVAAELAHAQREDS